MVGEIGSRGEILEQQRRRGKEESQPLLSRRPCVSDEKENPDHGKGAEQSGEDDHGIVKDLRSTAVGVCMKILRGKMLTREDIPCEDIEVTKGRHCSVTRDLTREPIDFQDDSTLQDTGAVGREGILALELVVGEVQALEVMSQETFWDAPTEVVMWQGEVDQGRCRGDGGQCPSQRITSETEGGHVDHVPDTGRDVSPDAVAIVELVDEEMVFEWATVTCSQTIEWDHRQVMSWADRLRETAMETVWGQSNDTQLRKRSEDLREESAGEEVVTHVETVELSLWGREDRGGQQRLQRAREVIGLKVELLEGGELTQRVRQCASERIVPSPEIVESGEEVEVVRQRAGEEVVLEIDELELREAGKERRGQGRQEVVPGEVKHLSAGGEGESGTEPSEVIVIDIKVSEWAKAMEVTGQSRGEEIAIQGEGLDLCQGGDGGGERSGEVIEIKIEEDERGEEAEGGRERARERVGINYKEWQWRQGPDGGGQRTGETVGIQVQNKQVRELTEGRGDAAPEAVLWEVQGAKSAHVTQSRGDSSRQRIVFQMNNCEGREQRELWGNGPREPIATEPKREERGREDEGDRASEIILIETESKETRKSSPVRGQRSTKPVEIQINSNDLTQHRGRFCAVLWWKRTRDPLPGEEAFAAARVRGREIKIPSGSERRSSPIPALAICL
jgi:hypothetical protein